MRLFRSLIALGVVACAGAPASTTTAPTNAIAKLEAQRAKKPNDARTLRSLGIAYFKSKQYAQAQTTLTEAARLDPKSGVTALYLGMSAEEQGDLIAARAAYTTYLAEGKTKSAKDDVNKKLAALSQRELQARAKAAVANERATATQTRPNTTVAVLPLTVVSSNPDYQALGRGLADLMISDFGKVGGLTLVERDRMQALLDEIRLGQSGSIDNATAARSGRLVQAGRVVMGTLNAPSAQTVSLSGGVVATQAGTYQGAAAGPAGALNALFTMEKTFVLALLRSMNVPLTPQLQAAITGNRPTQNIQAFIAYSRGLTASDQGRLDEAAQFFDNARALDPNFTAAAAAAASARAGQAGLTVTTAQIDNNIRGGSEGQVVAAAERGATASANDGLGSTLDNALADVNPSTADAITRTNSSVSNRDAATQTTAQDQATTRTGTLTIVIKRP